MRTIMVSDHSGDCSRVDPHPAHGQCIGIPDENGSWLIPDSEVSTAQEDKAPTGGLTSWDF